MRQDLKLLKRERLLAGLTQWQAAELIGVTQPKISEYENGHRPISDDRYSALLSAYRLRQREEEQTE